MSDRARLAALNNAEWCDAVARAHGAAARFEDGFWINPGRVPPFHPNLVTLDPAAGTAQRAAVAALARRRGGLGIKDSFSRLDLADPGFSVAFAADWLWLDPSTSVAAPPDLAVRRVAAAEDLAAWEQAWAGERVPARLFPPALLADAMLAFVTVERDGTTAGGGAFNRSERVLGISNVFVAPGADAAAVLAALAAAGRRLDPGLPLVGYEHGDSLALFHRTGFEATGPLRVWVR